MYTVKRYGDSSLWNLQADTNPLIASKVEVLSLGNSKINGRFTADNDRSYILDLFGSFDVAGNPRWLSEIASGRLDEVWVYKNDQLISFESWSEGLALDSIKGDYDFQKELVYFSGSDYFEGSNTFTNDDGIQGLYGNDVFLGYGDSEYGDVFFGGEGIDLSIYQGRLSDYAIAYVIDMWDARSSDGKKIAGYKVTDVQLNRDGTDWLNGVERLQFSDLNLALDAGKGEIAGSAYRIYKAAFDRMPDAGGLGFWIDSMDDGASLLSVARGFLNSDEFQSVYGANVSDRDYVTRLYNNVLDRNPDQGGYDFWLGALAKGASREDILVSFSESAENIANVANLIANGIQYEAWVA